MFDSQCDLAALVYHQDQDPDALLRDFAADLGRRGYRAVGLVQLGHHCVDAPKLSAMLRGGTASAHVLADLSGRITKASAKC
jgi:hypothetical protein